MGITIDTHGLIWYLDEKLNHKLSRKALDKLIKEEKSGIIFVPIVVLMEVLHLFEKKRISLSFKKIFSAIEKSSNYQIIPFSIEILEIAETIKDLEVHDRLIVSTALFVETPLISKDKEIIENDRIKVIW